MLCPLLALGGAIWTYGSVRAAQTNTHTPKHFDAAPPMNPPSLPCVTCHTTSYIHILHKRCTNRFPMVEVERGWCVCFGVGFVVRCRRRARMLVVGGGRCELTKADGVRSKSSKYKCERVIWFCAAFHGAHLMIDMFLKPTPAYCNMDNEMVWY